jgi:O-antigen/teichoic acid export membrane protein
MTRHDAWVDDGTRGPAPAAAVDSGLEAGPGARTDASLVVLARGTRANLIGTLIERGAGFALVIVLALLLSPAELGSYYEVAAILAVLTTIGVLGLDVGLVRATSAALAGGRADDVGRLRAVALATSLAVSGSLATVLWLAAPAIAARLGEPALTGPIRISCIAIPLAATTWIVVAPARGMKRMLPTVLAIQVTQPLTQLVAAFLLLRSRPTPSAAVWALVVAAAAGWGAAVAMAANSRVAPSAGSVEPVAGPLLRFSVPVCLSALIDSGLLWLDALILGLYRPASDVATYGLIVRFMTLSFAAVLTVTAIFGPFVTQYVERGDREGLQRILRTATRWSMVIACPVIMCTVVFGPRILDLLRQDGAAARAPIAILAVAFLVDAFTGPVGNVLTMSGRSSLNLTNNAVALTANVALDLLLVPRFGLVGAAAGWATVIVCVNAARVLQVRRLVGVSPFGPGSWKAAAAAAIAATAGTATMHGVGGDPMGVAFGLLVFVGTYLAAFNVLRPDPEDARFLRGLVHSGRDRPGSARGRGWSFGRGAVWALAAAVALALGAGVGTGSVAGLAAVVATAAFIGALLVPVPWLVYGSVAGTLLYRLAAPTSAGWVSFLPDALLGVLFMRIAIDMALGRGGRFAGAGRGNALRRLRMPIVVFVVVAVLSWIAHGVGVRAMAGSVREFLRFPLWAFALALWGIGWDEAKRIVWIVLGISLIQLPVAIYQTHHPIAAEALLPGVHFYSGDTITGTFGLAGSNSAMIFLTLAGVSWAALVLCRAIPARVLCVVAPAVVLPMALGSAALFVILLPAAVLALLWRAVAARGTRVTAGTLVGGLIVLLLAGVAARSTALAPGLSGGSQTAATSLLSPSYIGAYVSGTSNTGPTTRLGFLDLAADATVFDGSTHALLGLGPQYAVIGTKAVQVGPTGLGVLATASVQSVPRMLLGFGLLGLLAYLALLLAPAFTWSAARPADRTARALVLTLPIATAVYVLAGVYNAAWTDPGISCAFWTLVVAASAGASAARRERAIDVDRVAA